jgi:type II secretory pathway component HofQ
VLFNGQVEKITNGSVVFCEYAARADTHHQVTVAVVDPLLKPTANGTRVKLSPNAKRSPTVQPPGSCTSGIYTGKSFDFHLKALNIVDFFGLINELTGLNYILDSSVKGSVALEADIPWDQALALALKNNRLECKLYGHVLRVATLETLGTEGNHPDSTILKQTKCIPGGSNNMPIGIHVRDIAISDFFHFIHEESHLNVIVDPSVNDTLTMDVNERWDQLLDLVVRSKGLRCELEGDTLRIVALQR